MTATPPVLEEPQASPLHLNALSAIRVGVSDYLTGSDDRLSSGVRNLVAGLLLLCKEKLRRLSPPGSDDVLIYEQFDVVPSTDGGTRLEPRKKRTVTVDQIETRFKAFAVKADLKSLKFTIRVRNDLEHLFISTQLKPRCQEAFAHGFSFLDRFMREELNEDPRETLGADVWQALLEEHTIEQQTRADCEASFKRIAWEQAPPSAKSVLSAMRCPSCGSELLQNKNPDAGSFFSLVLVCRSCGEESISEDVIEDALNDDFAGAWHVHIKDGGDDPCGDCPNCDLAAYVFEDEVCYACGHVIVHVDRDYQDYLDEQDWMHDQQSK